MSLELLKKHRFVGIFRHIRPKFALQAAQAMYEGGIRIFEVTFDPSRDTTMQETGSIIRQLRDQVPVRSSPWTLPGRPGRQALNSSSLPTPMNR